MVNDYRRLIICLYLALTCVFAQSCLMILDRQKTPYCTVDYTIDGVHYRDETKRMYVLPNPNDKVDKIAIERTDTSVSIRWKIDYPFITIINVVSGTSFFEEGKKYHPVRYGVVIRKPAIYDNDPLELIEDSSFYSFYNDTNEEVAFVMKFELALLHNRDTMYIRDGKYVVYKKLLSDDYLPIQ